MLNRQPEPETEQQLEERVRGRLLADQAANHEVGRRVFEKRDINRLFYPRPATGRARWLR